MVETVVVTLTDAVSSGVVFILHKRLYKDKQPCTTLLVQPGFYNWFYNANIHLHVHKTD